MAQAIRELLPVEEEPFPLTVDTFHMIFHLGIPTVHMIPTGLELLVRDAPVAEVHGVTR